MYSCWWVAQLMTVIAMVVSMLLLYCTVLYSLFATITMDKDKRKRRHVCTVCLVACEKPWCDSGIFLDGFITLFIQAKQRVTSRLIHIRIHSQGSVWIKTCIYLVNHQRRPPWGSFIQPLTCTKVSACTERKGQTDSKKKFINKNKNFNTEWDT